MMEDYVPLEHLAVQVQAESLPISSRKVCLSYDEINVTSDDDDDEVRSCRVFALNSIASEWHCILNYDIIETGLNTIGRLKGAIGECIYIAHQCGFDVSCVSADQCPVSQQFYSNCRTYRCGNFKAKYLPELSSCNPLKKRIWFIPDMTHLLIGITRAILANGAFNVDCTLIMNAIAFYPEASISHFRPGYYHFGLTDIQTVQNVFSNKIINKIIEIEPESEEKTTSVEFMKKIKEFVENFSTLSRDNYESLLNEWILFFNSHECKKIENCLCGLKYIAEEMFNSNEEINTINTKECSTTWIEEIFFLY
ncbi:uncharacterized protein LOC142228516 [Haematobia irritans]|uniref:uncharacterized protein LOC142228516 n=1 Tax=Haematobia irritans TaxID=7368 RepID=UPI003F506AF0